MARALLDLTHLDQFSWVDLLDVLLLAIIIYYLVLLIRGTRAVQMLVGVIVLVLAYWVSGLPEGNHLRTVHRVLGSFLFYVPFALIVIFQDTIRKALADELLFGRLVNGGKVLIDIGDDDKIRLGFETPAAKEAEPA